MKKIIVSLFLLSTVVIVCFGIMKGRSAAIPKGKFSYSINEKMNAFNLELDDYTVTIDSEGRYYKLTEKKSGACRRLFNNPFEILENEVTFIRPNSMTGDENTIYYGKNNQFYSYDIDTDTTKLLYELVNIPIEVKVFDVVVYHRAVSRQEIETSALNYIMDEGNLYIITSRDIRKFDGKNTQILVKGEYNLSKFENHVMTLYQYRKDESGEDVKWNYEYDLNSKDIKMITL